MKIMKRTSKVILLGAVLSMALSSCGLFGGRKGPCPAYSKADVIKPSAEVVK
jgi:predicted small lipoprotein YifL